MANKIFRSSLFVAVIVLLCAAGIILGVAYDYFDNVQVNQLKDELSLAAAGTQQQGLAYLKSVASDHFRLTWVAEDGTVIYDTQADETSMENHADREEIQSALRYGSGSSVRYSSTVTEKTIYEAVRLSDGSVLRISVSSATTASLVLGMLQPICIVVFIAVILCAILSHHIAKRIVKPLNELDLEHPLQNDVYEEISPLLTRINQQHLQISSQIRKLQRKNDEFRQITDNMNEGLVLLDKQGLVLSLNPAAKQIFEADEQSIGKDFLAVDRSTQMRNAVSTAFLEGSQEFTTQKNGRHYRLEIDRITSQGSVIGAVVLAFDITERMEAERSRREFSANVSHELKTPLQSIIGSAELLENGLVKAEDIPRFVGHIRKEASRLVSLVEDIIRLSQLDEGVPLPMEEVDLFPLAQETAQILQNAAAAKDVTLRVTGHSCTVTGVRRLLYEILFNLCDNAIKYNVPGGQVEVHLQQKDTHTVLTVSDTGIGIPPEHREKIFERFYRVDKSHSKQSGGTGLGLSIVKHATAYHNAHLELQSTPGSGTTITVTF